MIGVVLFGVNTALAAAISFKAAFMSFGAARPLKVALGTLAGIPIIIAACVILTGVTGVLSIYWIFALLAGSSLMLLLFPRVRRTDRKGLSLLAPWLRENSPSDPVRRGLLIAMIPAFLAVPLAKPLVTGPYLGGDDQSQHAACVTEWVSQGRLDFSSSDVLPYHPHNAEAFTAWFVLPFHGFALVGLGGAFWMAFLWIAVASLVILRSRSVFEGMMCATLVAATPVVGALAGGFSSPELAAAAMAVGGLLFLLPEEPEANTRGLHSEFYAGLLLGFALGCSAGFIIPVAVVFCWLLLNVRTTPIGRTRWKRALAFCSGVVLTGGFWYARNLLATGNPLFPGEGGAFRGLLSTDDHSFSGLLAWVVTRFSDPVPWILHVRPLMDWPPSLWGVACVGYLTAAFTFVYRGPKATRHPFENLLLILGLTAAIAAVVLRPQVPYVLLIYIIGILLFGPLLSPREERQLWPLAVVVMGLIPAWVGVLRTGIALLVLVPAFLWAWNRWGQRLKSFPPRKTAGWTLMLAVTMAASTLCGA
jgi:hypothetical protein